MSYEAESDKLATLGLAHPVSADGRWIVPLSLKIVAILYIMSGILSITESILKWFVFDHFHVDLAGLLAVFVGRGLLRWQNGWRYVAIFFTCLYLVGVVVIVGLLIGSVFAPDAINLGTPRIGGREVGPRLAVAIIALIGVFLIWQLRVLRRDDIARRFKMLPFQRVLSNGGKDPAANPQSLRFSLGTLFVAMTVVAFVLARLTSDDVLYEVDHNTRTVGSGAGVQGAEYGMQTRRASGQPTQLLYVVFSRDNPWTSKVQTPYGHDDFRASIVLEDGSTTSITSDCQLYEIVDGKIITSLERISTVEFESFVESAKQDWTIDALLRHAEQLRQARSEQERINSPPELPAP